MSFRPLQSRRDILQVFMDEDGLDSPTPILREMLDFYLYMRLRHGRDAVRVELPTNDSSEEAPS